MQDAKWAKYAVLGGPWFVVLTIVGGLIAGVPPAMDASPEKTTKFFTDHSGAIGAGAFMTGLGVIGIVWWFGSLWRRMVEAEMGRPRISVVALVGLAVAGTLVAVSTVVTATVALRIDDVQGGARFFNTMVYVLVAMAGFGQVIFLAAVTSLSYRTKMFPAWTNYLGWLSALAALVGAINVASDSSAFVAIGGIGFLLWALWILAISWNMWSAPAPTV